MTKKILLFSAFLLILFAFNKFQNKSFDIQQVHGLWQSLNDKSSVVEFKENGDYNLYVNEESVYGEVDGFTQIKYSVTKVYNSNYIEIRIYDEDTNEQFVRLELQVVNKNRIRLLFLKHNDILDVADEYYRTDGFGNFEAIMSKFDLSNW